LAAFLLVALPGSPAAQPADEPAEKLPPLLAAKPLKVDPGDGELRKLLKARYNEALGEAVDFHRFRHTPFVEWRGDPDDLYQPWQRLVRSGLVVHDKPDERVTLLTHYLELVREEEKVQQWRYDAGRVRGKELHRARYERLQAEAWLLRAKREADRVKDK
jgi:hypothetical protein